MDERPKRAAGGRRWAFLGACLLAACPAAAAPFSVVGASGAMHVTFSVSPTKIRVGEYPWYRIELKNAGKKDLVFSDKLFEDPWQPVIDRRSTLGFVLKVEGPDGKPLFATPRRTIRDPRLQEKAPEPPNPEEMRKSTTR
ncbi:MAG: hypothetical protein HYV15_00395 [Elusimicrobia bacterium]|nr:hypothetical protein [Elusimicrobiota bacterium]